MFITDIALSRHIVMRTYKDIALHILQSHVNTNVPFLLLVKCVISTVFFEMSLRSVSIVRYAHCMLHWL